MEAYRNIALRAANRAGDYIAKAYYDRDRIISKLKDKNDFVSNIDNEAEALIIKTIKQAYPDHAILAEESGAQGDSETVWIIDPLDGSANFLQSIPHFAVSIAVRHKGKVVAAVIFDPLRDEMFSAADGSGAQLNKSRIRVSDKRKLDNTILATGFPFRTEKHFDTYMDHFKALFMECADMRRAGSAALDLAYVAAGRVDGFWEFGLSDWDTAAGKLIVKEAGGLVGDIKGNPHTSKSESIMTANQGVFRHMMQINKDV